MAGKKPQVSEVLALLNEQVLSADDITEQYGCSLGTLNMWARGAVPSGAPPFPTAFKIVGTTRLWAKVEADPWITTYYKPRK
jgi:hypothetical protein